MNNASRLRRILATAAIAVTALSLTACDSDAAEKLFKEFDEATTSSQPAGEAADTTVDQGDDYFVVKGGAEVKYDATEGKVDYCPIDELERPTCSYGLLTYDVRAEAQERGRQDISADPTGWPAENPKVEIPALDDVDGSKTYHGYMFNRSHLLADSLGGSVEAENLVPGTRTQNVGSAKNSGGMAHTETIARDYLDSAKAKSCSLYYAATPNYKGDELIPRTVTVDIQSCDKSIDEHVVVSNTANGFNLNYTDGTFTEK